MVTDRTIGLCVITAGKACFPSSCCLNGKKPGEWMQPTEYEGPQGATGAIGSSYYPVSGVGANGPSGPIPPFKDADRVNRPSHYAKWKIEPITFIMRNGMEFWRGNIIKYATRAGSKEYDGLDLIESEITDLEKVRRYAEMRINQLKGESIL